MIATFNASNEIDLGAKPVQVAQGGGGTMVPQRAYYRKCSANGSMAKLNGEGDPASPVNLSVKTYAQMLPLWLHFFSF